MTEYENAPVASTEAVHAHRLKVASERGCWIAYPEPNELFVDIDTMESFGVMHANIGSLGELVLSKNWSPSPSRKAGRYHVRVTLSRPVKDQYERIMLQLLLGSDPAREAIAFKRANSGVDHPTCFFEKVTAKDTQGEQRPTEAA